MRNEQISKTQVIFNNAMYKQHFTIEIGSKEVVSHRYVVSSYNLYTGKNPSSDMQLFKKINDIIQKTDVFDSIGGWYNQYTENYFLDCNFHFYDIKTAIQFAKVNSQIAIWDGKENKTILIDYKTEKKYFNKDKVYDNSFLSICCDIMKMNKSEYNATQIQDNILRELEYNYNS